MSIIEKMFGSSEKKERPTERTFGKSEMKEKEEKPKKSIATKAKEARQKIRKAGAAGINIIGSFDGSRVIVSDSGKVTRVGRYSKVIKGKKTSKKATKTEKARTVKRVTMFGDTHPGGMYHSEMANVVKNPQPSSGFKSLSGYHTQITNKKPKW